MCVYLGGLLAMLVVGVHGVSMPVPYQYCVVTFGVGALSHIWCLLNLVEFYKRGTKLE